MIKLERNFTPAKLTPAFVKEQTDEFKASKKNVWNIDWLKKGLLELSKGKCAYCECFVTNESNYMEVEHFEDKKHNPDKVLEWENLLPSCKRCNGSKSTHDVLTDPIVNPFNIIPQQQLFFRLYRFKGKTNIGVTTENALNINHPERAVKMRFEIGEALEDSVDKCLERLKLFKENNTTIRRNKLLNCIEAVLRECQPKSNYAGTCATVLHSNQEYKTLKAEMEHLNIWNDELQELHEESEKIIFEIR
jgi:hypothetical protein